MHHLDPVVCGIQYNYAFGHLGMHTYLVKYLKYISKELVALRAELDGAIMRYVESGG